MGVVYAVLGAGRQGMAWAYELPRNGQAEQVVVTDQSPLAAQPAAEQTGHVASAWMSLTRMPCSSSWRALTLLCVLRPSASTSPFPRRPSRLARTCLTWEVIVFTNSGGAGLM